MAVESCGGFLRLALVCGVLFSFFLPAESTYGDGGLASSAGSTDLVEYAEHRDHGPRVDNANRIAITVITDPEVLADEDRVADRIDGEVRAIEMEGHADPQYHFVALAPEARRSDFFEEEDAPDTLRKVLGWEEDPLVIEDVSDRPIEAEFGESTDAVLAALERARALAPEGSRIYVGTRTEQSLADRKKRERRIMEPTLGSVALVLARFAGTLWVTNFVYSQAGIPEEVRVPTAVAAGAGSAMFTLFHPVQSLFVTYKGWLDRSRFKEHGLIGSLMQKEFALQLGFYIWVYHWGIRFGMDQPALAFVPLAIQAMAGVFVDGIWNANIMVYTDIKKRSAEAKRHLWIHFYTAAAAVAAGLSGTGIAIWTRDSPFALPVAAAIGSTGIFWGYRKINPEGFWAAVGQIKGACQSVLAGARRLLPPFGSQPSEP